MPIINDDYPGITPINIQKSNFVDSRTPQTEPQIDSEFENIQITPENEQVIQEQELDNQILAIMGDIIQPATRTSEYIPPGQVDLLAEIEKEKEDVNNTSPVTITETDTTKTNNPDSIGEKEIAKTNLQEKPFVPYIIGGILVIMLFLRKK